MPEKPTLKESGIRLLMAAVLATVAVGIVYNIIQQVITLPGMPYNVRELFPESHRSIRIAVFSVMIVWMGLGPVWVGDFLSQRPRFLPLLPIWSVTIGLVTWSLLRFSVTLESLGDILGHPTLGWSGDWEFIGRFIALQATASLTLIMTSIAVASIAKQGCRGGLKRGIYGLLLGMPWVVLAWTIVVGYANTDNLTELIRATPNQWTGPLFLSGLLGLISLNTSMLCYVWMYRPLLEKGLAILVTPLFAIAGFGLLWLGLDPAVEKYGTTFPAARFLLGPDRETFMSLSELAVRWGAVQMSAVAVLTIGGLIALCLRPRIKSDITTLLNSDHEIEQENLNVQSRWRRVYFISTFFYAAFLLYGSMIPFGFHSVPISEAVSEFRSQINLNQNSWSQSDMVTNTAMFVPLMFCALGVCSRPGQRLHGLWKLPLVFICGVAFSLLLEFSQIYIPGRTVSSHDIISQTLGNLLGITAWFVIGIPLTQWLDGLFTEQDQLNQRTKLLYFYIALFIFYSVLPLDFTISLGQIWQKYKAGMINFVPFAAPGELEFLPIVMKTFFYIPIGYLLACRFSRRWREPFFAAAIGGLFFATAVEGFQVLLHSRYATLTDVILGSLGAVIGAVISRKTGPIAVGKGVHGAWWKRWGIGFKLSALIGCVALLVSQRWEMLELQRSWEEMHRRLELSLSSPLGQMVYNDGPLHTVSRLAQEFAAFLLLGMLLQTVFVNSRYRQWYAVTLGIGITLTLELGRLQFSEMLPDSTLLLTAIFGVAASTWAYPRFVKMFFTPDGVGLK